MILPTVPSWTIKRHRFIVCISIASHFLAIVVLLVVGRPKGYDSFADAHGVLGTIGPVISYLILWMSERPEHRRLGFGLTLGAWFSLIAPGFETTLVGLVGIGLFCFGVWASEVSRQLDGRGKSSV